MSDALNVARQHLHAANDLLANDSMTAREIQAPIASAHALTAIGMLLEHAIAKPAVKAEPPLGYDAEGRLVDPEAIDNSWVCECPQRHAAEVTYCERCGVGRVLDPAV